MAHKYGGANLTVCSIESQKTEFSINNAN